MAEGFNTDDMLDMYLFENTQLLERLQEIVDITARDREAQGRFAKGGTCLDHRQTGG